MESFQLLSLERYQRDYTSLGEALGVAGAKPAPGELDFLRRVSGPSRFGFGMLEVSEIFFAAGATSILRPRMALEIGTASGSSAAIIGKMIALRLEESGGDDRKPLLHTIDKSATCSFDHSKPIGFGIELITPELGNRIVVHPQCDSSSCGEFVRPGQATLGFIDGNHRHPWPLFDLLQLLQVVENGWILLHDIDLPGTVRRARAAGKAVECDPDSGAELVFRHWPGRKISSGNIGVIEVPPDSDWLGKFVEKLRAVPSEVNPQRALKQWRMIDSLVAAPRRRGLSDKLVAGAVRRLSGFRQENT